MKGLIPTLLCDFYKTCHREQYPQGTEVVYSTWTPRSGKLAPNIKHVVSFGIEGFIKEFLLDYFNENFFSRSKQDVVNEYSRYMKNCLLITNPHTQHIEDLHDLGYLPLHIKALEEGTLLPFRVPMLTVENTDPRFFWLTNYIETLASANLWKPATTASIAKVYNDVLTKFAMETVGDAGFVQFQGHDFSMRGMSGLEDSARSGAGHLLSFVGTDTIPAIQYVEAYYGANVEKELIGCSVNASEHSVMCCGSKEGEYETYRRLIQDVYPTGIVSLVSDTWDLFNVITNILPQLKPIIMSRNGGEGSIDKVVIRPDSGDPADILCGDPKAPVGSPESKGVVELLFEIFGGSTNDKGFKLLDSHIGAIYGDSITIDRCTEICQRLKDKGFASTNVVFGIGSYTYQYLTRDSLGFAMKATSVTINGVQQAIFKDPKTDNGTKKSAMGRVKVIKDKGTLVMLDESNNDHPTADDLLTTVFLNGKLTRSSTFGEIRERLKVNSSELK